LNPRWTAGMEVLHLAGNNPVQHHHRAWRSEAVADATPPRGISASEITSRNLPAVRSMAEPLSGAELSFGKASVYAPQKFELTHRHIESLHQLPRQHFADLPSHQHIGA